MRMRSWRQPSYLVSVITFILAGYPHGKIICCAFTLNVRCKATIPIRSSTTASNMVKGGIHGKKTRMMNATKKKKKTKNPNVKTGKHRKTSKRDGYPAEGGGSKTGKNKPLSAASSTKSKSSILLGETAKSGPPWQVMGGKDAQENAEAERARRERIRAGVESPSAGGAAGEPRRADVSGANRLVSPADRTMLAWRRFNPTVAPSDLLLAGMYLGKKRPPSLGVPEVAFLGRSNVGKSSLLNGLVARTGGDVARVGKTPGATASVNLYALMGRSKGGGGPATGGGARPLLGLADLPGFGYAKLSKETKERVEEAAERYLGKRRELALGVLLVDSRRVPGADDRAVLAALYDLGVPLVVAATKSDKLRAGEVEPAMAAIREGLGLPDGQPLRVSGVTGEGVRDLWRIILEACETRVEELRLAMEEGRDDGGVMRLASGEEGEGDDFYGDVEDGGGEEEIFEDGEDVYYDQGYDWVQGESVSDADAAEGGGDFYDDFYDDQGLVDDGNVEETDPNEEKQRMEREAFKLVNLELRVKEMEKRGEI